MPPFHSDSGEDAIVNCDFCNYAANIEKAEVKPSDTGMNQESISDMKEPQKVLTPGKKTVQEVTAFLNVKPDRLVKTLIYETDKDVLAVLVRGDHEVNEIKLRNLIDSTELSLASDDTIIKKTHAPVGFSGPIGLNIRIIADNAVSHMYDFVTGGNEKDTHLINVNLRDFKMDTYADLRVITNEDPCPRCSGKLRFIRGIEVGHVFKLGKKYSESLGATYLNASGKEEHIVMGCYGIGVGRTIAAAIEQNHDCNGIIFPTSIAPFQVMVLPIHMNNTEVREKSETLYTLLKEKGYDVLIDDREESPGVKFKDADLIGIPIRLSLSKKNCKNDMVELKVRRTGEVIMTKRDDLIDELDKHLVR
ncbi:MAG: proline--tRNA ligase [Thermodesulfobacteriota bacterium]|nr:proline--tRNA ligase [Thermodesulfobacteriota bacterium]